MTVAIDRPRASSPSLRRPVPMHRCSDQSDTIGRARNAQAVIIRFEVMYLSPHGLELRVFSLPASFKPSKPFIQVDNVDSAVFHLVSDEESHKNHRIRIRGPVSRRIRIIRRRGSTFENLRAVGSSGEKLKFPENSPIVDSSDATFTHFLLRHEVIHLSATWCSFEKSTDVHSVVWAMSAPSALIDVTE